MMICAPLAKSPNCASQGHQRLGIVTTVAIFKSQYARLGERGIVDLAARLAVCDVPGGTYSCSFSISARDRMALVKRSAAGILPGQPDGYAGFQGQGPPSASASAMP